MKFFDTHAHCDDKRFEAEYEGGTVGVITDCLNDNVSYIINIGTDIYNSRVSVELAEKFEMTEKDVIEAVKKAVAAK